MRRPIFIGYAPHDGRIFPIAATTSARLEEMITMLEKAGEGEVPQMRASETLIIELELDELLTWDDAAVTAI